MVIEGLKSFTYVLAFNYMTKHHSQKVMNFRHLLSCDTIAAMHVMNEADEAYSISFFCVLLSLSSRTLQNCFLESSWVSDRFFLFSSATRDPTKMTLNGTAKFFIVLNNYLNYQSLKGNPSSFLVFFFESKVENLKSWIV